MEFKKLEETIFTDNVWYDLTDGGYIKPEDLLLDPIQINEVKDALELVIRFIKEAYDKGIIEEI